MPGAPKPPTLTLPPMPQLQQTADLGKKVINGIGAGEAVYFARGTGGSRGSGCPRRTVRSWNAGRTGYARGTRPCQPRPGYAWRPSNASGSRHAQATEHSGGLDLTRSEASDSLR